MGEKDSTPVNAGVYAALVTPVTDTGAVDFPHLVRLVDFVIEGGVDGVCIGGGTSEYPHFDIVDRKRLITEVAGHLNGSYPLLVSIGAGRIHDVIDLGRHAFDAGCHAILLPMPHFYHYEQEDLEAFSREVVQSLGAPCLLYNLPATNNLLAVETIRRLFASESNIVGIKDSSGETAAMDMISDSKGRSERVLFCGADPLLYAALEAGWEGAISGIASFCPEALAAVHRAFQKGDHDSARRYQGLLDELIAFVELLPFPWSIRVGVEVRGIPTGPLPLPQSESRRIRIHRISNQMSRWMDEHLDDLIEGGR